MRSMTMTVILLAGVVALVGLFPLKGLCNDKEAQINHYSYHIDREISWCRAKTCMLNSRSEHLRDYAQGEIRKAEFLSDQKERLIQELLEKQIPLRHYKIHLYLNSRFHDEIQ
jgi:hypothetical protein